MAASRFFAAALSKPQLIESHEKPVRLPTASVNSFRVYLHWVYTGEIGLALIEGHDVRECDVAYVLGDALMDAKICNMLINAFSKLCVAQNVVPNYTDIKFVYDNTPDQSKLRKLCVDMIVGCFSSETFSQHMSSYDTEFVIDLAKEFARRNKPFPLAKLVEKQSEYHELEGN